jgi:hypothetical protein
VVKPPCECMLKAQAEGRHQQWPAVDVEQGLVGTGEEHACLKDRRDATIPAVSVENGTQVGMGGSNILWNDRCHQG